MIMRKEIEGRGEMPRRTEQKIIKYVKTKKNLGDETFHKYVERMGISPHEAEEVIYRAFREESKRRK